MINPRYHSQCGEDEWIVENLKPPTGIFCEIGAFDGITSSNTLAFEDMGWGGICVEADPFLASQLHQNRKCKTLCAAVGIEDLITTFSINESDRGLSGLIQQWNKEILVRVISLSEVLDEVGECGILSIDTEGTELNVWESRGDYSPNIVIMEYQTRDLPSEETTILKQMSEDRYTLVHKTQYNLIFTRD